MPIFLHSFRVSACSAILALGASAALAQDAAPAPPPEEARGWEVEPGTEAEDVALFVPRAVLTIPRVVVKVVFWPIQKGLRFLERHAVLERIDDVLYNDARTMAVVPVFSFLSSQGPTIGFKAFHRDLGGHGEKVSLDARFGGTYVHAYQLGFEGDRVLGSPVFVTTLARFEVEPALLFKGYGDPPELDDAAGIGPRDAAVDTRFQQRRLLVLGRMGYAIGGPGAELRLGGTAILNNRAFDETSTDERSIGDVYDTSQIVGFDQGVKTLELDANVVVDTRDERGATSSGVYLELFGGGVPRTGEYQYGHVGGEVSAYFDLYRGTRVLVLRAAHEAVLADEAAEVPFSELPRLGGPTRLRGYALDRFRDEKSAVTTLEYHYPIHEMVAGALFIDAGQVAPTYGRLFTFADWHLGGGGGFILRDKKKVLFTIDVAYGDGVHVHLTTDPLRAFAGRDEQL